MSFSSSGFFTSPLPRWLRPPRRPRTFHIAALFLSFALGACDSRQFSDGREIANIIIKQAKEGGEIVDLTKIADITCFVHEGTFAGYPARHLLPGYTITFSERDDSEGYWYFVIGSKKNTEIQIYGIPQIVLSWEIPENLRTDADNKCTSRARVERKNGEWLLTPL